MHIQPTTMNSSTLCFSKKGANTKKLGHLLRNQLLYCKNNDKNLIRQASLKATNTGVKITRLILDIFQGDSSNISRNKNVVTNGILGKNTLNYIA